MRPTLNSHTTSLLDENLFSFMNSLRTFFGLQDSHLDRVRRIIADRSDREALQNDFCKVERDITVAFYGMTSDPQFNELNEKYKLEFPEDDNKRARSKHNKKELNAYK